MTTSRAVKMPKTDTDIAVLLVKVNNIESDINEIKQDLKDVTSSIAKNNEDTHKILKDMSNASTTAHSSMSDKISSLEKWRWMMMGAGIVLGTLGYDTVAKLLK